MSATHHPPKLYHTDLTIHAQLLIFPLSIVPIQASYYCAYLSTRTSMDTELCVYVVAGKFTMIVSVKIHDNQVSKSGANYDDKLMHATIVMLRSVEKY